MSHLKKFIRKFLPNPFDQIVHRAAKRGQKRFLVVWNRGLGDIPLGLYALKHRLLEIIPDAQLTFLTRPDLAECFRLLGDFAVIASERVVRGTPVDVSEFDLSDYDVVLDKVDPTYWFAWQLGTLTPKLQPAEKSAAEKFKLDGNDYVGVHVSSETGQFYGYEKNWAPQKWRELFEKMDRKVVLFGMSPDDMFDLPGVVDLRGKTNLVEMLSVIQGHCDTLLAPDSGVLSVLYYVNAQFPLRVVSLWSDPRQGVLRQKVASPNRLLKHFPLISEGDLSKITTNDVLKVVERCKS